MKDKNIRINKSEEFNLEKRLDGFATKEGGVISSEDKSKLALKKSGTAYFIRSPYSKEKNIIWRFDTLGINELQHLKVIYFQDVEQSGFNNMVVFQNISTDWISPYNFSAINNVVNTSILTTGGNHGTKNGTGFRTAYPKFKVCKINGEVVTKNGEYYNLDEVVLESQLDITSSNVLNLETGEGFRDVISEFVSYSVVPKNINVTVKVVANEDVEVKKYAGPQISGIKTPYKKHFFGGDINPVVRTVFTDNIRTASKVAGSKVDRMVVEGAEGLVVIYKDKNVGVNDLRYMGDKVGIGQLTATKAYIKNFEGKPGKFSAGESFYYTCTYSFTKPYECEGSIYAYKVNDIYIVDFDKAIEATYFKVDEGDIDKEVLIIDAENVNADRFSTVDGVKITSCGKGWFKFKLIDKVQ